MKRLVDFIFLFICSFIIFPLSLLLLPNVALSQPDVISGGPDITGKFQRNKVNSDGSSDSRITNQSYNTWIVQSSGIQVTDIAGGTTIKSPLAIAVMDYAQLGLMVSFAAADTDSVAFEIFIVAKQSTVPADGIDMIMDMDDRDSTGVDGFLVANNLGLNAYPASIRSSRLYMIGKTNTNVLNKGTGVGPSGTTTNAVFIPITTVLGTYITLPIIHVWVRNRKVAQLDDVTIDLWCKTGG